MGKAFIDQLADFYKKSRNERFSFDKKNKSIEVYQLSGEEDYTTSYRLNIKPKEIEAHISLWQDFFLDEESTDSQTKEVINKIEKEVDVGEANQCNFENYGNFFQATCGKSVIIPLTKQNKTPDKIDSELLEVNNEIWRESINKIANKLKSIKNE